MKITCFLLFSIFVSRAYAASGRVKLRENDYGHAETQPVPQSETEVIMQLEYRKPLSEKWLAQLQPSTRLYSAPNQGLTTDLDGRNSYLETRTDNFYLEAGSFIKDWEGTDGINPMDIATVKSYRDPINTKNLGSWGVSMKSRGTTSWSWDVLFVPWQTPPKLPFTYSGWWPRTTTLPLNQNGDELLLPSDLKYALDSPDVLNHANQNNFGYRLQFHGNSWDSAVAVFQGQSQLPLFRPTVAGTVVQTSPSLILQLSNPVHIQPVEYLRRTYSAMFDYNFNPWIFRMSGRRDSPLGSDPSLPSWSEQFVAGIERTIVLGNQTGILSLQYARGVRPNYANSFLNLSDPFQNAILLGGRLPITDNLVLAFSALRDFSSQSYYGNLKFKESVGENWSFSAAADVIGGPATSLFGLWKNQSRGYVTAVYGF